jgi:uncharacterized protein YjbI with pentapeptide repeats
MRVNCFTPGDRQAPISLRCIKPSHMGNLGLERRSGESSERLCALASLVVKPPTWPAPGEDQMTMDRKALERMAARELLRAKLNSGVEEWNEWRSWDAVDKPDFRFSPFENKDFRGYNFGHADFTGTRFLNVDLSDTNLSHANLSQVDMINVKLCNAKLHKTEMIASRLVDVDLSGAKITDAQLASTILIDVKVQGTTFSNCTVYGVSTWNLIGEPLVQERLIVTPLPVPLPDNPEIISVESIEVAQFIHLIINNKKIRNFIDTVTSKTVLILGSFKPGRKEVLDGLRGKATEPKLYSSLVRF